MKSSFFMVRDLKEKLSLECQLAFLNIEKMLYKFFCWQLWPPLVDMFMPQKWTQHKRSCLHMSAQARTKLDQRFHYYSPERIRSPLSVSIQWLILPRGKISPWRKRCFHHLAQRSTIYWRQLQWTIACTLWFARKTPRCVTQSNISTSLSLLLMRKTDRLMSGKGKKSCRQTLALSGNRR